jgi:hypothetical protein
MAVAHASEMAVLEVPHVVSMHPPTIPSILDRLESNRWAEADLQAHFPSVPAAFGGIRSFSNPNTDRPSSSGEVARSVATKDSNEALGRRDASPKDAKRISQAMPGDAQPQTQTQKDGALYGRAGEPSDDPPAMPSHQRNRLQSR